MSPEEIIVSAPGSLMLMGEHAVLHGRRALCAAINRRVCVRLRRRADRRICIRSALGQLDTTLDQLAIQPPFTFVLATLHRFRRHLPHGLDITIEAEFSHELGFGSSAAVTVALVGTLILMFRLFRPTLDQAGVCKTLQKIGLTGQASYKIPLDPPRVGALPRPRDEFCKRLQEQWLRAAIAIIRSVQGVGSGADAAASLLGGVVLYRADPLELRQLPAVTPRLTAVYSGHKTPTAEVIRAVARGHASNPRLFNSVYDLMDACVARAVPLLKAEDWGRVGELMNLHHGLQAALGTNTPVLEDICHRLRAAPGITGAKISGSGLGDCAVGLGWPRADLTPYTAQRLQVERHGATRQSRNQRRKTTTRLRRTTPGQADCCYRRGSTDDTDGKR
jgi:mevalonate kinase